jgi:hypothetical protein
MHIRPLRQASLHCLTGLLAAASLPAHALPSYARQTGEECAACHIGAFGPQLTSHGIKFKLGGYTDSDGKDGHVPLSGMLLANWTHTSTDNAAPPAHFNANNNLALQEASLFLAGKLSDHVGSFVQTTYSGIERRFGLDQMDLRYARSFEEGGKDLLFGVSLNNNPTVQDPFNTTATWRFPFTASDFAPAPTVSPLIDGGLAGGVLGATAYALWDGSFYGELGGYRSLSAAAVNKLGPDDVGKLKGTAPYFRVGYMKDMRKEMFAVGLFGLSADLDPNRIGAYDKYRDIGVDATYQFLGDRKNIYTVHGSYTQEKSNLDAVANPLTETGRLSSLNLNASYFYDQTYGVTLGLFDTRGNNSNYWNDAHAITKPDSRGYTAQLDWTPWGKESSWNAPWANLRLGLQYTGYNKFDGASAGAHDNNSVSVFAWTSF